MFVAWRLHELVRKRGHPLYACFIDLTKAYKPVELWAVLGRAGVPPKMLAIIRGFHDGVKARVKMDDGKFSDWFDVEHGLRQGCNLTPLLFNVFFAAILRVSVAEFRHRQRTIGGHGEDSPRRGRDGCGSSGGGSVGPDLCRRCRHRMHISDSDWP